MMAKRYSVEKDESLSCVAANAADRRGEGKARQHRRRQRHDRPGRIDDAEGRHHREINRDDDGQPGRDPGQMPEQDVVHLSGVASWAMIRAHPFDRPHHRIGRVVGADLHAGPRQQPRREVGHIGHAVDAMRVLVDQRSQGDAHRRQVQHGNEEAGDNGAAPGPPVLIGPITGRRATTSASETAGLTPPRRAGRALPPRGARALHRGGHAVSVHQLRPSSRKKTSSSVERRTSVLWAT